MPNSILSSLRGSWILRSMYYKNQQGTEIDLFGKDPLGIVTFDDCGNMNAQMGARNRTSFAINDLTKGTLHEISSAFQSYMAFFGKYTEPSPGLLSIELEGSLFPNWQYKEILRYATILENRLILRTPPIGIGEIEIVIEAHWNRSQKDIS